MTKWEFIQWGIPLIFSSGFFSAGVALVVKSVKMLKVFKGSMQALLRAQMISEFNKAKDKGGFAPIYAKDSFENMWKFYHALGANGVMDDIHETYINFPVRKGDVENDKH